MSWEKSFIPCLSHPLCLEHSHKMFLFMKVTSQIKTRSIWKGLLKVHKEIVSLLFLQVDNISIMLQGKFLYSALTEALQNSLELLWNLQLKSNQGTQEVIKIIKDYHRDLFTRKPEECNFSILAFYSIHLRCWRKTSCRALPPHCSYSYFYYIKHIVFLKVFLLLHSFCLLFKSPTSPFQFPNIFLTMCCSHYHTFFSEALAHDTNLYIKSPESQLNDCGRQRMTDQLNLVTLVI